MQSRAPQLEAVTAAFLVLAWITVGLRVWVRACMIKQFGPDDSVIIVSLISYTVYCSFVFLGCHYGTGRHVSDLTAYGVERALMAWWFCELFYAVAHAAFMISVGLFLMRIADKNRAYRLIIWALITLVVVFGIVAFFFIIFQCSPPSYFWRRVNSTDPGSCSLSLFTNLSYANSAITSFQDFSLSILPIFVVWKLKMNLKTKISVGFIFLLAAIGSIATLVRVKYLISLENSKDFLWATTDVAIWSSVEVGLGNVAGSLGALKPLFRSSLGLTQTKTRTKSGGGAPFSKKSVSSSHA